MFIYKMPLIRNWVGFRYKRTFSPLLRQSIFTTDKWLKPVLVHSWCCRIHNIFSWCVFLGFCFVVFFSLIFFNPTNTRPLSWPVHNQSGHLGNLFWVIQDGSRTSDCLGWLTSVLFVTTFLIQAAFFHKYANELRSKPLQNSFLFMFPLVRFSIFTCLFILPSSSQPLCF